MLMLKDLHHIGITKIYLSNGGKADHRIYYHLYLHVLSILLIYESIYIVIKMHMKLLVR